MSGPWIEGILHRNAEIVAADEEVTALLQRLCELHREGRDKAKTAGLLVTKLKRLMRLRDQRDRDLRKGRTQHDVLLGRRSMLSVAEPGFALPSVSMADIARFARVRLQKLAFRPEADAPSCARVSFPDSLAMPLERVYYARPSI